MDFARKAEIVKSFYSEIKAKSLLKIRKLVAGFALPLARAIFAHTQRVNRVALLQPCV
jgi:hypothetical protein